MDLSTLTALEEYLTEVFDGCLVVVSHDNFFVNRVAEHLFLFEGDGVVRDFEGALVLVLTERVTPHMYIYQTRIRIDTEL